MKNKKAAGYPLEKIIGILILITVFVVLFLSFFQPEEGWLNKIAEYAQKIPSYIPGRDQIESIPGLAVPEHIEVFYDNLFDKFYDFSKTSYSECWIEYDEIPNLKKHKIQIQASEDGSGLYMWISDKHGTKLSAEFIPDLKPCIVAGYNKEDSFAAEIFVYYYDLKGNPPINDPLLKDMIYSEVDSLTISKKGKLIAEYSSYNLEDYGNLLYMHDSTHICFIPGFGPNGRSCYGKEEGLDNNCFDLMKSTDYLYRKCRPPPK